MILLLVFSVSLFSVVCDEKYYPYYMSAPFSSFKSNLGVNVSNIPLQAKLHHQWGVNLVWVNGGLAQFQALTMDERKSIAETWVKEGKKYEGMDVLIHCTDLSVENSQIYAKHAESLGADYVSFLPPFYQKPSGVSGVVEWLKAVMKDVKIPFFYYHIPGSTGVQLNIYDLVVAIDEAGLNLGGVKFVDSHDKVWQFQQCLKYKSGKYAKGMMWAAEPKLAVLPFGARSIVLAEGYYAPYYIDLTKAWDEGDQKKSFEIQEYVQQVHEIISSGGNKNVLQGWDVYLGPNRLPATDHTQEEINSMLQKLRGIGFIP